MLMPVYGMGLFCAGIVRITPSLPKAYLWLCMCGTIVLTVVIPVLLLLYLKHKGRISFTVVLYTVRRSVLFCFSTVKDTVPFAGEYLSALSSRMITNCPIAFSLPRSVSIGWIRH